MGSITRQLGGELQSQVAFQWQSPQPIEDTTRTCGRLTHLRKQLQQNQLLASIHTCIVSLLMYVAVEWR